MGAIRTGGARVVDAYYGGAFRVTGSTTTAATPANVPVSRRVRLHDQVSGKLVRETWSDAAGLYAFERIAAGVYFVIAFDHTGLYGGVVETDLVAEPMP